MGPEAAPQARPRLIADEPRSRLQMRFLGLKPGTYALKVTMTAFNPQTHEGIKLGVDAVVNLRVALPFDAPDAG